MTPRDPEMNGDTPPPITDLLRRHVAGDSAALGALFNQVYSELKGPARRLIRQKGKDATLSPTDLLHEAFVRLVDAREVGTGGKTHFFAIASRVMHQILVDHHRRHRAQKRGGDRQRRALNFDIAAPAGTPLLDVVEAVEALAAFNQREAHVVELRFLGGLTVKEVATALGVSVATVEGDWRHARAWLRAFFE